MKQRMRLKIAALAGLLTVLTVGFGDLETSMAWGRTMSTPKAIVNDEIDWP
ncbi:hypothetical protein [Streptomyces sp. NPDC057623]|uniref:hypothetical protein n=1 Tax=Streptomyces sp. NPDC057623 TaxID=3346187 RepID=UPI00368289A3